jgi:hypothetical protein
LTALSYFATRDEANAEYYGKPVEAKDILSGKVQPPAGAKKLLQVLSAMANKTIFLSLRDMCGALGEAAEHSSGLLRARGDQLQRTHTNHFNPITILILFSHHAICIGSAREVFSSEHFAGGRRVKGTQPRERV